MRAKQAFVYGFKMLLLGYFDGKMLIPCDMSLHRESKDKDYGLNKKEQKRQHRTTMPKGSCGGERFAELDEKKTTVFLKMLKRAVNKGFSASYVLMDSWFVNDEVIKGIRRIKRGLLHVVGICKMDRRKFAVGKMEYNSRAIININTRQGKIHNSKKYKSQYMVVQATYKGVPVKLFYVRYRKTANWTLLLTTDLSLSFNKAMEIYQIRWTIEVLFKECRQYLRPGKSQNTDFNGQIADTTLALATYTILSLEKRFKSYETIGALFRENHHDML
jgi:IS4 transposase